MFGFPVNSLSLQRIGKWCGLAIAEDEVVVDENVDFDVVQWLLPFFIDLVLEDVLDNTLVIALTTVLAVDEHERNLILVEAFLENEIVNHSLPFVDLRYLHSESIGKYSNRESDIGLILNEFGVILVITTFLLCHRSDIKETRTVSSSLLSTTT